MVALTLAQGRYGIMIVARTRESGFRAVDKWELTRGALTGLLVRLDEDPIAAGERYEQLRRALLKFFSWHQTPEAESAVDETLDRLARRLAAGHPIADVPAFAYGVARLVRLERQRQAAMLTGDERLLAQAARPQADDIEVKAASLQRCLDELPERERDLILGYYVGTGRERIDGRARLAAALGLSENALRHRAQRLRDRLRVRAASYVDQGVSRSAQTGSTHIRRFAQYSQESAKAVCNEPGISG
jgi:DNA-directed RNA polymerase specialized sigma24 family protein